MRKALEKRRYWAWRCPRFCDFSAKPGNCVVCGKQREQIEVVER